MSDGIYCLALVGAVVYYLKNANSFADGVVGILKAIVWPAVLVYRVFQNLHM